MRQRIAILIVLTLTVAASIISTTWGLQNPVPLKRWAYPYFWLPVIFAALPLWWPRRAGFAAGLMVAYTFSPLSLSVGILFVPATIGMVFIWFLSRSDRAHPTHGPDEHGAGLNSGPTPS